MKVNISYAVELDDVPVEVGKLLTNAGYYMATLLNSNILGGYVDIQGKVSSGVLTTEEEVDNEPPI